MELLKFLLFHVHPMEKLFNYERFAHLNKEQAWMMIESAKQLADQEMAPHFREMDEMPARFEVVICPVGYDKSDAVRDAANHLHQELLAAGVDVVLDDRGERPGAMFADWELIGVALS